MEGRRNLEVERRDGFAPPAVVSAGPHLEAVGARRKVGIEGLAPRAGVLPRVVPALQPILERDRLRRHEAERGIAYLDVPRVGRQRPDRRGCDRRSIGNELLDPDRDRLGVDTGRRRVDDLRDVIGREPQATVGRE